MNINASVEIKGVEQAVVPRVDLVEKGRPQLAPVEKSERSAQSALDQKAPRDTSDEKLTNAELAAAVQNIQSRLDVMRTSLGFVLLDETDDIVIEVTDRESGELIRQIPSEEVMEIRAKLDELVGILFDKKA